MKQLMLIGLLSAAALPAAAKDKMIVLSEADAAALQGKTVALTVHERPDFTAMTAGKAAFGLFGVAGMISAGNKLVDENHVQDPAVIVRTELATAIANAYGAQIQPVDTAPTKAVKPKDVAATHPEADYVLDVRSGGWMHSYFPTRWGTYWVAYSVQVQLVDTKTQRQVSNVACNANTHENPKAPTKEQLYADGAQLLKDVTTNLGWTCVQLLAKEQFRLSADKVAATPAAFVDPLANIVQLTPVKGQEEAAAPANAAPATGAAPAEASAPAGAAAPTEAAAPAAGTH